MVKKKKETYVKFELEISEKMLRFIVKECEADNLTINEFIISCINDSLKTLGWK